MLKDNTIKDLIRLKVELERKAEDIREELRFIEQDVFSLERIIAIGLDGNPAPDVAVPRTNQRRFKNGELQRLILQALKEEPDKAMSKHDIAKRVKRHAPDVPGLVDKIAKMLPKYRDNGILEAVGTGPRRERLWRIAGHQAAANNEASPVLTLRRR